MLSAVVLTGCEPAKNPASGADGSLQSEVVSDSVGNSSVPAESNMAEQSDNTGNFADASQTASDNKTAPHNEDNFTLEWNLCSTWEDNGRKCGGYEVKLVNNSSDTVNSWKAEIAVPNGFEIISSWNGVFAVSENTLTVQNVDYNGTVESGKAVEFGFNFSSPTEFKPENAVVNGTAAGNGGASSQTTAENAASQSENPEELAPPAPSDPAGTTPVAVHGQLAVKGTQLVDENGNAYQLRGMSTHGLTWFPDFINEGAFQTLRDDWNTNVVRLSMYIDEWGNEACYMQNKQGSLKMMETGVDICIKLGMYVIIDWHVLNPGDPSKYTGEAAEFFDYITEKYADYPNVIYEICNEPNSGADWNGTIKPYAETIIPVIRKNDGDSVIIVGTPTWCQDIDAALANPLDFDNVMYALHFYAATHTDWLRERAVMCIKGGLPLFVSEFGCCDASGGGANDFVQAEKWLELLDSYGISYCNWAMANKDETCCAFVPTASSGGDWYASELSESGQWIRNWFKSR